jgi:hypothetical protein
MTYPDFTEAEIENAWGHRQKRQLRSKVSKNMYIRLLKVFKRRGMVALPQNRKEYVKQWRLNNPGKVAKWTKRYQNIRKLERHQARLVEVLGDASIVQLNEALRRANELII